MHNVAFCDFGFINKSVGGLHMGKDTLVCCHRPSFDPDHTYTRILEHVLFLEGKKLALTFCASLFFNKIACGGAEVLCPSHAVY